MHIVTLCNWMPNSSQIHPEKCILRSSLVPAAQGVHLASDVGSCSVSTL